MEEGQETVLARVEVGAEFGDLVAEGVVGGCLGVKHGIRPGFRLRAREADALGLILGAPVNQISTPVGCLRAPGRRWAPGRSRGNV